MNKLYLKKLLVALTMAVALATTTAPVNRAHAVVTIAGSSFVPGGILVISLLYVLVGNKYRSRY